MTAKQFIDKLEQLGLLSPDIVQELRRQVDESKAKITAGTLARLLVDNGHLTKFQATKLISEESKDSPTKQDGRPAEPELGLAPEKVAANKAIIVDEDDESDLVDVDVVEEGSGIVDVELVEDDVVDVEVVQPNRKKVVEAVEVADDQPKPKTVKRITKLEPSGKSKKEKKQPKTKANKRPLMASRSDGKNPWDSHRILTVGAVLGLLGVFAIALIYYFTSESADKMLELAEDAYKPNNYEMAQKRYEEFAGTFSSHKDASLARVRIGMCQIRKDIESLPDPIQSLKTAEKVLPTIAKEPAIASERGDVAGALVMLAQKFNKRADNAPDIESKKQLMAEMKRLDKLLIEPQYVGSAAREQFGVAMRAVEEDTKRIERDIMREEDLRKSLAEIDDKLKQNQMVEAYQVRAGLLSRFPQLESDPGLMERVQEAARIQLTQVGSEIPDIKVAAEAPVTASTKSIALANRAGKDIPAQAGRVIPVATKGTVYGLDAQNGSVRWRYYVGRDMVDDPLPMSDQMEPDVVVCRPDTGHLIRLDGSNGKVKWFCELGSPTNAPRVDAEDMLVALKDGSLLNIEPESGQVKWAAQTRQTLRVTPNVSAEKPIVYVPADHHNIFCISRQDGKCQEVYYLGHRDGSISVPPVHLLNLLFVFENRTPTKSTIHILQTDEAGLKLSPAQESIEMDGNITTMPLLDGRKMVVMSDLGQVKVFDVQVSGDKSQVSVLASEVASETKPSKIWGVTENNQLWTTNVRFARWDVQVSTGKLVRPWIVDEADQFVGPPLKFGDIIVHRRIPRGNRGVRVSAVTADNATVQWVVDLGVPVIHVASPAAGRYDAILATGAQFAIDPTQTVLNRAEYNTDTFKPGMNYVSPRALSGGGTAFQNTATVNRILTYTASPSGEKVKQSMTNFSTARPTAPATAVGNNLAFGLDNGQLLVIDPSTGLPSAQPYQPQVEPGKKHQWNEAAYLADAKALFATDNRKLYRLAVSDALRPLSEIDLSGAPIGPVALAGKHVSVILNKQTEDTLVMYESSSLSRSGAGALDGRWQAGPFTIEGDSVLVQTDRKLQAFGEGAKKRWELDFPRVRLVGPPTVNGSSIVVAATNGQIWFIDPLQGTIQSQTAIDQPLSAAPLVVQGGMLLGTDEGSVILLPRSETPVSTKGAVNAQ